jgi:aminopeptidase-like protein
MIDEFPMTTLPSLPGAFDLFEYRPHLDRVALGQQMYAIATDLYPLCRSITGNGVRQTLEILQRTIPLTQHEVPTGTPVFDWHVPKEWNIHDAYLKNSSGQKLIDLQHSNLHVLNYSTPIHTTLSFSELQEHLFSLSETPDLIPYRTSYYKENWGFCLSHNQLLSLDPNDTYEVFIDTSLSDGHLTYGEYELPGESRDEILISCHTCHPSLANDNLSGIVVATCLAQILSSLQKRHYTYRFLFIPGTIGSITWLALNEAQTQHIKHGLVLTCVGDPGSFTYKKSRQDTATIDRAVAHVLKHAGHPYHIQDFFPYGYDERQYCSPGFNLPVGCLMRSPHGTFSEYHTSGDNLNFIQPQSLAESLTQCLDTLIVLENNRTYQNQSPKGEPQLGKRGLYKAIGGQKVGAELNQMAILWVLNLADGHHNLLDIAERADLPFNDVLVATKALAQTDLLCLK